jgi:hypothetical protein
MIKFDVREQKKTMGAKLDISHSCVYIGTIIGKTVLDTLGHFGHSWTTVGQCIVQAVCLTTTGFLAILWCFWTLFRGVGDKMRK